MRDIEFREIEPFECPRDYTVILTFRCPECGRDHQSRVYG